ARSLRLRPKDATLLVARALAEGLRGADVHAVGDALHVHRTLKDDPKLASYDAYWGTAWRLGVSGRNRCLRERIVGGLESLSEAGAERAVIDGAANLKQKIRPSPRPAHLLRFVHPAVHQKIGRPFGDRGANPQSGTVPL